MLYGRSIRPILAPSHLAASDKEKKMNLSEAQLKLRYAEHDYASARTAGQNAWVMAQMLTRCFFYSAKLREAAENAA
jgi:hypothetical protein